MKTKLDILDILNNNRDSLRKAGLSDALEHLRQFKDTDSIDVIAKDISSNVACYFAIHIGDKELMIDKVTDSYDAFRWAYFLGNKEIMIKRINNSRDAAFWVNLIGDRQYFIDKGLLNEN